MSGTSRIGGYGNQTGGDRQQSRSASLTRFCRGRKQGDVVSGTFLRLETEQFGWALLEGEELLAHLPENWAEDPGDGHYPAPGARVFFRIESLVPDVVLRMLPAADPLARLAAVFPSVPLAQEAALYAAARDKLDALVASALRANPGLFALPDSGSGADLEGRKDAFSRLAASSVPVFDAFAETLARSRALRRSAAPAGLLFFQHIPWLSGAVSQIEVSLWREKEAPVFAGARLPSGDRLLLRGVMEDGVLRYRLGVVGAPGRPVPAVFFPPRTAASEYRGLDAQTRAASPGQAVDLVGRILALAADSGTMAVGRFSRKL